MSQSVAAGVERFDPASPELSHDPYLVYRRYQRADPVHWGLTSLAGYPGAWYVFGHEDVVSLLRDPRLGKERGNVRFTDQSGAAATAPAPPVPEQARPFFETARQWIVHRDPPAHTRLRRLLQPYFTASAAERMRPRITEMADELLDRVQAQGSMELIADFALPLPVNVIAEMLGVPEEGRPLLTEWSRRLQAVDIVTTEDTWRQAGEAIVAAREYLGGLVAERRRRSRDDLLSVLLAARRDDSVVSDDEMLANALFLFVAGAGFQTTTALIGSLVHAVLDHPGELTLLREDPTLVASAVNEALRWEPPIQMTNRIAAETIVAGGKVIHPGDSVLLVIAAANRDPEVFADPDRFRVTRRHPPNHAFGVGIHRCLGGPLATVEAEVALQVLLRRLPGLRIAAEPEWNPVVAIRVLGSLRLSF